MICVYLTYGAFFPPHKIHDEIHRQNWTIKVMAHFAREMNEDLVGVWRSLVQGLDGTMFVYGDGKQSRSFCYVSDLVEGIYKLLQLKDNPDTPINLGNPNEFTILELAKVVIETTNSKSEIVNNPLPLDDPKQRCPDISLAKSTLNWKPTIELREGIEKTAAYFKQII